MKRVIIAALAAATIATTASADIYRHGAAWWNSVDADKGGNVYCSAGTNDQGRNAEFSIATYGTGLVFLHFFLGQARVTYLGQDAVDLVVEMDGKKWTLWDSEINYASDGTMHVMMTNTGPRMAAFLADIALRNVVVIRSENGSTLARFSLSGSSAAIGELGSCVDKLGTF